MKIKYDADNDMLTVIFRGAVSTETTRPALGVMLDYDENGDPISITILQASMRVEGPGLVTLQTRG